MRKRNRRDPAKEKMCRARLKRFDGSGQSVAAFCAEEGVNEHSFASWRREIKKNQHH
jgi:transposase-like protein